MDYVDPDAEQYEEAEQEVAAQEQVQINVGNNPLLIPQPRGLSFAYYWNLEDGGQGNGNMAPSIATVNTKVQNYRDMQAIDNDPGRLLREAYPNAFQLARRRYNLKAPADIGSEWLAENPSATDMKYQDPNPSSRWTVFLNKVGSLVADCP